MANEVKVKLTADGKQLRSELKLIDKELQELGNSGVKKPTSSSKTGESKTSESKGSSDKVSGTDKVKQESRDKVNANLLREISLVRKELQKFNSQGGQGSNGGGGTTPPSSGSGTPTPSQPSGGSGGSGGDDKKGLGQVLGKLLTATVALKAASSAWSSLSSSARSSATGESLAYKTFGSTLAYTDYNTARKDASNMGSPYGYDYDTVMNAGNYNMSRGGFTNIDNYNSDMNALLKTSKAWGIDTSSLAGTSGYMTSIGVTESGEQKKFADLLAESIVEAEMTGREDEQLQVLEEIAENLASRNDTVSGDQLNGSLGMYNALVNQNENLKGTRGSNIVTNMQDLAASGNSSLDILAGFGTKYTGLSGQLELRKLAEENPNQYWAQVYEGVQQYGLGDDYFKKLLYDNVGSVSQAEDIMSSLPEMAQGTYNINDTSKGESATDERISNYSDADVSTQEQHDIEKKEASDDRGNFFNNIMNPFRSIYDNSPDWLKQVFDGTGWTAKNVVAPIVGMKGASKLWGKIKGGFGGSSGAGGAGAAGEAAAGAADDVVANAADDVISNSVDDVVSNSVDDVIANSADDVIANATDDVVANSVDDVLAGGADDVINGATKGSSVFGKLLGPAIQLGIGAYKFFKADNDWDKSGAVGETGGGIVGGLLGSVLGPVGSILGGWAGGELGDAVGRSAETGKQNWGSVFAGDWNIANGLWRKNGTLTQQKNRKAGQSAAESTYGGLPSDYGLPEVFDDYLDSITGNINWSGLEGALNPEGNNYAAMKNKYGMSYEELENWKNSDEYKAYLQAAADKQARRESLASQVVHINKGDENYDKSLDPGNGGYDIWTGTEEEWNEYKNNMGEVMVGSNYNHGKGAYDNPYMMNEVDSNTQDYIYDTYGKSTESTDKNTESIDELTSEVSEMRQWLENNGYKGTAAWTDDSVKEKYNELHSTSNPLGNNTSLGLRGLWGGFSLFGKKHATGNDYVPYDNYAALLHKGEMVLTSSEADDYRQGKGRNAGSSSSIDININLNGNVNGITPENQSRIVEAVVSKITSSDLQDMISNGFIRVQNH